MRYGLFVSVLSLSVARWTEKCVWELNLLCFFIDSYGIIG